MLMVNALAGTGKTTTGLWGLGAKVPDGVKVSDEQKLIVETMREYKGTKAACAFNRSIADELKERAPMGITCATTNSFGNTAWLKHLQSRAVLDELKNRKLCRELLGTSLPWKERNRIETAVNHLVALCKCYLFDPTTTENSNWLEGKYYTDGVGALRWLVNRFDVDWDAGIADYTQKTFTKGVNTLKLIDWNDQIFMPIYHNVDIPKYGHVLFDEVQDANRAKQEFVFRMAEEISAIGDVNQAIYGFSGADADSMDNMYGRMKDGTKLPLTITRRNPKAVVRLANTIVPELKAAPGAPEGTVERVGDVDITKLISKEPCMVICRVNAPLTGIAFKLIGQNTRCYIQGRDIGSGIKNEIKKTGEQSLRSAIKVCQESIERRKMDAWNSPYPDENKIEALDDKLNCILVLAGQTDSVDDFYTKVDALFKDSGGKDDIRLSSVHKSKGLEHKRVIVYRNELLGRTSKKAFQTKQEKNLEYVAYTRSMDTLIRVFSEREGR